MAEIKIIGLPPLTIQDTSDIYEVSKNGTGSYKETRQQTLDYTIGNIAVSPYVIGDLVYADSTSTLNKIPDVAIGNVLLSDGVGAAPKYGKVDLTTTVSNILPVLNGGTGQSSYTDGQLLIGNTIGNTLDKATLTAGTGITITNGGGSITIDSTADLNVEYQDVYDNTVATSGDANTDLSNGYPFTLSSTTEVSRPFPSMTIAQRDVLVSPINAGEIWNADDNKICSNRGSEITPIWENVAYISDIPVIVNDGAYAEMSFQGNSAQTVISVVSTPVKINGTYVAGPLADFTHLNGVLTYTGTPTRVFKISYTISTTADISAIDVSAYIALNGSTVATSPQSEYLGSTVPAYHVITVQALVSLSTNDTLEAYIANDTNTDNLTVLSLNFTPTSIGGTSNITGNEVVISWNGLTTPTNVTASGLMDITGGVISTTAEANVVTAWNGSSTPLAITAGTGIDITGGVISSTGDQSVTLQDAYDNSVIAGLPFISLTTGYTLQIVSTTTPVALNPPMTYAQFTAISLPLNSATAWAEDLNRIVCNAGPAVAPVYKQVAWTSDVVVNSWDGSPTPVAVTAGTGIDITGGVITNTGSGENEAFFTTIFPTINYAPGSGYNPVWNTYVGSNTIPAYSFTGGQTIEISITGTWKVVNAAANADSGSSFSFSFGTTFSLISNNIPYVASTFNRPWQMLLKITRTTDASPSVIVSGSGFYYDLGFTNKPIYFNFSINPISYDETINQNINLEFRNGNSNPNTFDMIASNLYMIKYN